MQTDPSRLEKVAATDFLLSTSESQNYRLIYFMSFRHWSEECVRVWVCVQGYLLKLAEAISKDRYFTAMEAGAGFSDKSPSWEINDKNRKKKTENK